MIKTVNEVYNKVKDKVTRTEFDRLVDVKADGFAGICDQFTVALLVAHDLGVSVDTGDEPVVLPDIKKEKKTAAITPLASIVAGMGNVSMRGVILSKQPVKTFTRKDGDEGVLLAFTLGDDTGKIRVTAWAEKAQEIDAFQTGDTVEILHAYTKEGYSGGVDVNISYRAVIQACDAPIKYNPTTILIGKMTEGETCGAKGVVTGVDDPREFTKKNGQLGRLCGVWISDDTGRVRVVFWDEYADQAAALSVGDTITIPEVRVKAGYKGDGVELSATGGFIQ